MKKVLFDLDGTITNSYGGIARSVIYACGKFGLPEPDEKTLKTFIGPPLYESFKLRCGLSDDDAKLAVKYYREYYEPRALFDCEVYEGIPQTLAALCEGGVEIYLATCKPEVFAVRILEKFCLSKYFSGVAGATLNGSRIEKTEVIAYAIERFKVKRGAFMVGDRNYDILGAKACGLKSIGVKYGFGGEDELKAAEADYIAATPQDIAKIVLS